MKPMEIKAAKEELRTYIENARNQLIREIKAPCRIPQRIVDAPLSEVIEFKQRVESIGHERFIIAPPASKSPSSSYRKSIPDCKHACGSWMK